MAIVAKRNTSSKGSRSAMTATAAKTTKSSNNKTSARLTATAKSKSTNSSNKKTSVRSSASKTKGTGKSNRTSTSGNSFRSDRVDIYIKEKSGSREIRIPWLPDKIEYKSGGGMFATFDIMGKGEISIPTGSGLASLSWESAFPGENRDDTMIRGSWVDPSTYHSILEDWKNNGTALNVIVTCYPINMDVYLSDYNASASSGFGDIEYDLEFKEIRTITITSLKEEKPAETVRSTPETTSYTIKKGDCLWSISSKFLGAGTKWTSIYELNKDIIESTARKYGRKSSDNGHWIYPGVTIQIPAA